MITNKWFCNLEIQNGTWDVYYYENNIISDIVIECKSEQEGRNLTYELNKIDAKFRVRK